MIVLCMLAVDTIDHGQVLTDLREPGCIGEYCRMIGGIKQYRIGRVLILITTGK
jgi:hypothetical protein